MATRWQVVMTFSEDFEIEASTADEAVALAYDQHPDAEDVTEVTKVDEK